MKTITKKYLRKLSWINIVKKKERTRLSLISIMLSTAMIYTSLTLFLNVVNFSSTVPVQTLGNFHYAFNDEQEIQFSSRYQVTKDYETGYSGKYHNQSIQLRTLDVTEDVVPFTLIEGTFPNKEDEILVSEELGFQLQDQISLTLMKENEEIAKEFNVVGIYRNTDAFLDINTNEKIAYVQLPKTTSCTYYVKDLQIQAQSTFDDLMEMTGISGNDVYQNTEVVSSEVMAIYLQNPQMLMGNFILIILLCLSMSLISIHNIILVSDEARKKELGLLKSIGANQKMVSYLLNYELMILGCIGSMLGIAIGMGISVFILRLFIERFYLSFSFEMVVHPMFMVLSFVSGCLLMYLSGHKAYRKYFSSNAVDDLKDAPYEYAKPVIEKSTRKNDISWNLFLIYNQRMKQQTKNIFNSFVLLLVTSILFSSVFLSNVVYKNLYTNKEYDIDISKQFESIERNYDFINRLYDLVSDEEIMVEKLVIDRLDSNTILTKPSMYYNFDQRSYDLFYDKLDNQTGGSVAQDMAKVHWCNLYFYTTWLDQQQLEVLEPYIVEGSYEDIIQFKTEIDENGVVKRKPYETYISILVDGIEDDVLTLCNNFHVTNEIGTFPLTLSFGANMKYIDVVKEQNAIISVLIVIPKEDVEKISNAIHIPLDFYPRIFARSYELLDFTYVDKYGILYEPFDFTGYENIKIKLKNSAMAMQFQNKLDNLLIETGAVEDYTYINYPLLQDTMSFSVFIVEVLLFPLFLMLYVIALMNIHNVFRGNTQLKRNDISIMKSVGMKTKEAKKMFVFEYLEGYLNACFLVSLVVFVISLVMAKLKLDIVVDAGNIMGSLFVSILIISPLLISILVYFSIRFIKNILPIEHTKKIQ